MPDPTANHLPPDPAKLPCPECGSPRGAAASPAPWPIRHRLLIQFAAIALALGFWAYKMAETWPALPAPTIFGPGTAGVEFPPERFTREDLLAYASGERADGKLLKTFDVEISDPSVGLDATLTSPAGYAQTATMNYGWPHPIVSSRKSASYTDVYTLANPTSTAAGLIDAWLGWAHVRISIDELGRRERRHVFPERAVSSLMVIVVAAIAGRMLWILAARLGPPALRRRRRPLTRPLTSEQASGTHLRVVVPILAATAAAIAVTAFSLRPWVSGEPYKFPAGPPPTAPTGMTFGDVKALANVPGGEGRLASALLAAADAAAPAPPSPASTPSAASPAEPVLAYGWNNMRQMEQFSAAGGWPAGLLISRIGPAGASQPDGRWGLSIDRNSIIIRRFGATDPAVRSQWSYSLAALTKVAGALLVIWYSIAAACALWRRLLRRRDRRRTAAGRCIRCGYDLA